MKKGNGIIYKMIARYIFEIILVVTFMIVSYVGFTANNLSEASEIASLSESDSREIQAVYALSSKEFPILDGQELINKGSLFIKNPNKTAKDMDIVIQLRKSDLYKIGDLNILVNGKRANMGIIMSSDETYEVNLGAINLDAYESYNMDIAIYSRVGVIPLEYSFKVVGSF